MTLQRIGLGVFGGFAAEGAAGCDIITPSLPREPGSAHILSRPAPAPGDLYYPGLIPA